MEKVKKENKEIKNNSIGEIIEKIAYTVILVPLSFVAILIAWQLIVYPENIPNIFGYRVFIIFDEYMDDSIQSGDLVFTKIVNTNDLKNGQLIAFRNGRNMVTIHKIIGIDTKQEKEDKYKLFTMKTLDNETLDTKFVKESRVEGLVVHRIPKLGSFMYTIQKPITSIIIEAGILLAGLIWIYVAGKLDERDAKKAQMSQ